MFAAAKLKPIVIDESLTGLHALMLSREMGYTGAALKACKGQSNMMILAPVMEKNKMFLWSAGSDLSGGLTDSIGEPVCSRTWREGDRSQRAAICTGCEQRLGETLPGIFHVTDGTMDTSGLNGLGIGAVAPGQEMAVLQS